MTIIADDDEAVVTPDDDRRKAYAVHVENDTSQNSTLAIRNCTIKSKWSAAIGIGLRPNFTLILENCTIETTHVEVPGGSGSSATRLHCGALYFHDSATMTGDNQRIILKNCIIKSTGSNAITTLSLCDTNSKAYITAYNNIVWCDENKKNAINHRIAPTGDAWAGNNIFLTEDSFGNNVQELNYNS